MKVKKYIICLLILLLLIKSYPYIQNTINEKKDMSAIIEPPKQEEPKEEIPEERKGIPNKFFNYLEDEAASMNMDSAFAPINEPQIEPQNTIEVLDDIELVTPEIIPTKEEPQPQPSVTPSPQNEDEDVIMPFFFEDKDTPAENNIIEEKKDEKDAVVDPMDSVIKLDPNYTQIVEEEAGLDLKTAINEIRDVVENLKQKGFNINLDEIDLSGNYQMTINIKEND